MKIDISILTSIASAVTSGPPIGAKALVARSIGGMLTVNPFSWPLFNPVTLSPGIGPPGVNVVSTPRPDYVVFALLGGGPPFGIGAANSEAGAQVQWVPSQGYAWVITPAADSGDRQFYSISLPAGQSYSNYQTVFESETTAASSVCWLPNMYTPYTPKEGIHLEPCDPTDPQYTIWGFFDPE
jgi:hypothetical protein